MPNITVRGIPDNVIEKIKTLSKTDKRSINSEILVLLENGLTHYMSNRTNVNLPTLSIESQLEIWNNLSGKWEDERKTEQIIEDIYCKRTKGRDVELWFYLIQIHVLGF